MELDGKDWRPEPLWKRRRVFEELIARERMICPFADFQLTDSRHGRKPFTKVMKAW
jgi:ATP-dependent DNA ligase